jgi:hypothetical protein
LESKTEIKDWSSSLQLRPEWMRRMEVLRHQRAKCETGARRSVASTSHMIPSHITTLGQIQPSLPVTEDQRLTA